MREKKTTPTRKRRSNVDIERAILNAVHELIDEVGFSRITISAVVAKAKIEPIVFYKRYKDIDDLFGKFVAQYGYWFGEPPKVSQRQDWKAFYLFVLEDLVRALNGNKTMRQLLLWELEVENPTTIRTAMMRDAEAESLIRMYDTYFKGSDFASLRSISAVLIAGIYYLMLHKDRSAFCGIHFNTKEGLTELCKGLDDIVTALFDEKKRADQRMDIALKMKEKGLDLALIADCTSLSITALEKL